MLLLRAARPLLQWQMAHQAPSRPAACYARALASKPCKQRNLNTVVALAGNKADLLETRQVQIEEAKTYAQENGFFFMETSAKTAINVNVFYEIAKRLLQGQQAQNPQAGMVLSQT